MNRLTKQMVAALLGVGSMCGTFADAYACGGRGGGGYYRARPVYVQPSYPAHPPAWTSAPTAPVRPAAPITNPAANPMAAQRGSQLPPAVQRMSGGGVPAGQQQASQVAVQPRQAMPSPNVQQPVASSAQRSINALQSLGGNATQLAQSTPVQQPRTQQVAANRPQNNAPQPEAASPMDEAQRSALLALGGDDAGLAAEPIRQASASAGLANTSAPQATHVGQWKATIPNNATVELTLNADGSFVWVAINGDKTSSFEGSYTLSGGALTLVSSDNQKLAGQLTPTKDGGINFKLNGTKDAGLNFVRS
jgi:hypothetical protein